MGAFPEGSFVGWELLDKDVELIEGGIRDFSFDESLQPYESHRKERQGKYGVIPVLNWGLRYGDFNVSEITKRVAVTLKWEQNQSRNKGWVQFYHNSRFLGKWDCGASFGQFKQTVLCVESKVKEKDDWEELVHATEEKEKEESGTGNSKRKKRKVALRNKNTYKFPDVKLHPLVMSIDSQGNWEVTVQMSLFCVIDDGNNFAEETNRLLTELFNEKNVEYTAEEAYRREMGSVDEFNHLLERHSKQILREGVQVNVPSMLNVKLMPFQMESVDWMLRKEGFYNEPLERISTVKQLKGFLNEHVSFGYEFMPINNCFWNKVVGYICPLDTAWNIYEEWLTDQSNERKTKGLLADEMGLGKTVEMIGLITTNRRDLSHISTTCISSTTKKEIYRAKTNLIVCPVTILEQWIDEIHLMFNNNVSDFKVFHYEGFAKMKHKFNNESSINLAKRLSEYDVVITSYNVLSAERRYANFGEVQRPSRKSTRQHDYSSPLINLEFFRVILDEVQLLGHVLSYTSQCLQMVNRIHSWCMSGTPVQSVRSLQDIFSHLQLHPFQLPEVSELADNAYYASSANHSGYNESDHYYGFIYRNWDPTDDWYGYHGCRLTREEIFDIFPNYNLAIRHLKKDVQDQIKIPKQVNYLIPVEFNPVERDNYTDLWDSFLSASGYDSKGRGTCYLDFYNLKMWLDIFRLTCCHASLKFDHDSDIAGYKWRAVDDLKDMDAVLDTMKQQVSNKISRLQRENYAIQIHTAQVKTEAGEDHDTSTSVFQNVIESITNDLRTVYGINDFLDLNIETVQSIPVNDISGFRSLLQLLHQAIYLLATSYYQLGSKKLQDIENIYDNEGNHESLTKNDMIKSSKESSENSNGDVCMKNELVEISNYQNLEREWYATAKKLRREMLRERIADVNAVVSNVRNFFAKESLERKLKLDYIILDKDNFALPLGETVIYQQIIRLFERINKQTEQFNGLIKKLEVLCYETIDIQPDDGEDAVKLKDFSEVLRKQNMVKFILDTLERILTNREDMLISEYKVTPSDHDNSTVEADSQLLDDISKNTVFIDGDSLRLLLNRAEDSPVMQNQLLRSKLSNHTMHDFIECHEADITRIQKENKNMKIVLERFNDIYDAKVDYFNHLQLISESQPSPAKEPYAVMKLTVNKGSEELRYEKNCSTISNLRSRRNYLNTLSQLKSTIAKNEAITCAICYSDVYTGSILKCGHLFCKGCVIHWFQKNSSCPLCKTTMTNSEVYHFKFRENDLQESKDTNNIVSTLKENGSDKNIHPSKMNGEIGHFSHSIDRDNSFQNTEAIIAHKYSTFSKMNEVNKIVLKNSWGGKVDQALKLILYIKKQHMENDPSAKSPQIVICSMHPQFFDILGRLLSLHKISFGRPLRDTPYAAAINIFKKNPECTCLFLRSRQEAVGLTLVNARHLFIMDPIMESSTEAQALSRIHRIGQKQETYVWNFMVRNTVEESIIKFKVELESKRFQQMEELKKLNSEEVMCVAEKKWRTLYHWKI
ncbi:unnamed protein product [Kluyveromyces dobzhanskii CBS 2104]|uniref:WGS project CCBQ000000000 data, contig 00107 n=1 Tax=Kluyveromyces dobzhanskii CBS 2104 TaxID=1427455 RepID=A0A0A8KZ28_9SACH|nr:unnamed protein product [Kluyveromyces dobzhanskii CBS 2104]